MAEISVIIPVYQAAPYLRQCLDSVLRQSFSDLEVLAVDDGSTDGSGDICQEYAQKDSRVRWFHQENAGQAAARNRALREAAGNWICFVDSDDRIHPQMLELLYQAAQKGKCPISQCSYTEAAELPENFLEEKNGSFSVLAMNEATIARLLDEDTYPGWISCAKLIRRELVEGYPFREGRVYEDNEAVCRWIVAAGQIADLSESMYFYRTNPESTTKRQFSLKQLDYLWALESILRFYGGLGWTTVVDRFLDRYVEAAAGRYRSVRQELGRRDIAAQLETGIRSFLKEENLHVNQQQYELLLEAMRPNWMRFYWPLAGVIQAFRQGGVKGIVHKAGNKLGGKIK